jgi:hypothetical protein
LQINGFSGCNNLLLAHSDTNSPYSSNLAT